MHWSKIVIKQLKLINIRGIPFYAFDLQFLGMFIFHKHRSIYETEGRKGKQMPFIKTVCLMLSPQEEKEGLVTWNGDRAKIQSRLKSQ